MGVIVGGAAHGRGAGVVIGNVSHSVAETASQVWKVASVTDVM